MSHTVTQQEPETSAPPPAISQTEKDPSLVISKHQEIINVSNRLPISIGQTIQKSSGGLISAFEDIKEHHKLKWIGWPGKVVTNEHEMVLIRKDLEKSQYIPIFLSKEQVKGYYHQFSNSSLWPILHYFTSYCKFDAKSFKLYKEVNEIFANKIAEIAKENGIVWIHDYHLLLLPAMLKKRRPDLKIGFFLHTPFPSYEIFRTHPNRAALLEGMLGADLIGFHTFGYLRHFRSAILRILDIDSEIEVIHHHHNSTHIGVFPIGISWERFERILGGDDFNRYRDSYKKNYAGKKLVLSVERLDYAKGIPEKLNAIELFLKDNPKFREKVVFIQITIPSREQVDSNKHIEEEIVKKISYINGKYATIHHSPIHFIHHCIDIEQLSALYNIADVALVTPLIDGMNLVSKEYIACRTDCMGTLVLSEFAGAAQELFNAVIINPYDTLKFSKAIKSALLSEKKDLTLAIQMRENVIKQNSEHWALKFLSTLTTLSLENQHQPNTITEREFKQIKKAKKIGLFVDYDGTLREFENDPLNASPTKKILTLLKDFISQEKFDVHIISGRQESILDKWFEKIPCMLLAEHGYSWKHPNKKNWHAVYKLMDLSWKLDVLPIFEHFALSTPGSFVEKKTSSLVWHYRKSDPDFGQWKALLLVSSLRDICSNLPVEIRHGNKIVEICAQQINKGHAMAHLVQQHDYDLVICAGDDVTDEHMFKQQIPNLLSIKVGIGDTNAHFRLGSPEHFRSFLTEVLNSHAL